LLHFMLEFWMCIKCDVWNLRFRLENKNRKSELKMKTEIKKWETTHEPIYKSWSNRPLLHRPIGPNHYDPTSLYPTRPISTFQFTSASMCRVSCTTSMWAWLGGCSGPGLGMCEPCARTGPPKIEGPKLSRYIYIF
jgi:hypothetical protein